MEENKEGESSSAVVVEDTDFSFIDSLSDITKDIAAQFTSRAQQISRDTWDKVFAGNGRVIGGYFDITSESGLTSAQLDSIMSSDEEWDAMMANPTIPSSQKELLQGFRNAIISKKEAIGYDSYDTDSRRRIDSAIFTGAHGALGATTHKYQADKNFESPELRYRKERDKVEDAEKDLQQKISKGESPFYVDEDGNQYFQRGSTYWIEDKDGKTKVAPTTASKLNQTESASDNTVSLSSLKEDALKAFPIYMTEKKDKSGFKGTKETTAKTRFDKDAEEVNFYSLSPGQQSEILGKIMKYGLTPNQIIIYRDKDSKRSEFAIAPRFSDSEGIQFNPKTGAIAPSDSASVKQPARKAGELGGF